MHTHRSVTSILREIGWKTTPRNERVQEGLKSSLVPIFEYNKVLYINALDVESFKVHMQALQ